MQVEVRTSYLSNYQNVSNNDNDKICTWLKICLPPMSCFFQEIVNAYAQYLADKKHTSEAALMYSLCEQWEQALDLYKDCGLWHQAFCMAGKLGYKQDQMIQLATTLAGNNHVHCKIHILVIT